MTALLDRCDDIECGKQVEQSMKWRKIVVNDVEYSWRVHNSADNIEVRGPFGARVFADASELLGVDSMKMHTTHWAFDRHHKNAWYVELPVTPKAVAGWIRSHVSELNTGKLKQEKRLRNRPKTHRRMQRASL